MNHRERQAGEVPRVMYVVPVLAPYLAARFGELGRLADFTVEVVLESKLFPERAGWVPVPIEGVEVKTLDSPQWTKHVTDKDGIFSQAYTKALPIGLVGAILASRPRVVVVCNPTQYCLALIARLLHRFRLGIVLEDTPTSEGRKKRWVQWLRALVYRSASFFVCFSADADDYARSIAPRVKRYRSSWSVDPAWLALPRAPRREAQAPLRFLFVGALIERKGVAQLVRAWSALGAETAGAELVLVGDGDLRSTLERACREQGADNVRFVGSLAYDAVREYYLSADIFILPTLEDLFSLVVTEAMAMGLPVITTVYNGARELVEEGETGFVCDPLRPGSLEEALRKALVAADRLAAMGLRARERMTRMTHPEVMKSTLGILGTEVTAV